MKRVALYCRISTIDQKIDSQVHSLREYCTARNFAIHREYVDKGISGTIASRPELNELMADARRRRFDTVICYRFDRFARSTKHLLSALEEFKTIGIDFISISEAVDTSTPLGEALFTIIGAISALERNIIRERVRAGLNTARAKGRILGRPKRLNSDAVVALRLKGLSLSQIGLQLGVTKSAVSKTLSKRSSRPPEMIHDLNVQRKGE